MIIGEELLIISIANNEICPRNADRMPAEAVEKIPNLLLQYILYVE
jgi:hypothetical protein